MAHVGALPKINRYITTHNAEGKAVFHTGLNDESKMDALPDNMAFALSYTTQGFPVDMNDDKDIKVYETYLNQPVGLTISGGTVLRHVDFPPTNTPIMHRTVSLDYGVVLEGSIYCVLDSGEERLMKRGANCTMDVCIQRGTMHAWRNASDSEWCRMMFVLQESKPLEIAGKKFGEDLGNAVGIPDSQ